MRKRQPNARIFIPCSLNQIFRFDFATDREPTPDRLSVQQHSSSALQRTLMGTPSSCRTVEGRKRCMAAIRSGAILGERVGEHRMPEQPKAFGINTGLCT